jgi:hypothetical protein
MGWYFTSTIVLYLSKDMDEESLSDTKIIGYEDKDCNTIGKMFKIEEKTPRLFILKRDDKYGSYGNTLVYAGIIRKNIKHFLSIKFELHDSPEAYVCRPFYEEMEFLPEGYRANLLEKLRTNPPNYNELLEEFATMNRYGDVKITRHKYPNFQKTYFCKYDYEYDNDYEGRAEETSWQVGDYLDVLFEKDWVPGCVVEAKEDEISVKCNHVSYRTPEWLSRESKKLSTMKSKVNEKAWEQFFNQKNRIWKIGQDLDVCDSTGKWRPAHILNETEKQIQICYYDCKTWKDKDRIHDCNSWTSWKDRDSVRLSIAQSMTDEKDWQ